MDRRVAGTAEAVCAGLLGLLFVSTSLVTYWGNFQYAYELTFISNALSGLLFFAAGLCGLLDRPFPQVLFLDAAVLLLMVLGVCIVFQMSFNGPIVFLHLVNPLPALAFYLLFSDQRKVKKPLILTTFALPGVYLVFALIFGAMTGNYIYIFLDYPRFGLGKIILSIAGIAVGILVLGGVPYILNRLLRGGKARRQGSAR